MIDPKIVDDLFCQVAQRYTSTGQSQIAPITGNNAGLMKAEIKQGIREVILCKDQEGKIGLRVQSVNKVVREFTSFFLLSIFDL